MSNPPETHDEECFAQEIEFVTQEEETTCTICYAEFLDIEDLNIHIKQVHNQINQKQCELCPAKYTDLFNYATHVRDIHLDKLNCCIYCNKMFMSNTNRLVRHQSHHKRTTKFLSCSQCVASFKSAKQLEIHEFQYHNNDLDGIYLKCTKVLASMLKLNINKLLQSHEERVYVCHACWFESVDLKTYLNHLDVNNCKSYICDKCGYCFKGKRHLMCHFNRKFPCNVAVEDISCQYCKKRVNVRKLIEHNQVCQSLTCDSCQTLFKNVDELSKHHAKCNPRAIENLMRCKFCHKEFVGQMVLIKHVVRVHKPSLHLYKYKCNTCNEFYQHPKRLFAHYFYKHKDIHPYTCKACDKTFRIRRQFTLHIKLTHKSVGFVEFDKDYKVFFSLNKSEDAFVPQCVIDEKELSFYDQDTSKQNNSCDDTEIDEEKKEQVKKEKVMRKRKVPVPVYSSDDEPLLEIKKKIANHAFDKKPTWNKYNKKRKYLTCKICQKYCYTYQNYNNHMTLHKKNEKMPCIKCGNEFDSQEALNTHMNTEHASSKLTETLKKIIEKRKGVEEICEDVPETKTELTKSEKFMKTIKKVHMAQSFKAAKVTITRLNNSSPKKDISVQKFLENFTPDTNENVKLKVTSNVTIKEYNNPYYKIPTIKLKKFESKQYNEPIKLKMPEKFKAIDEEKPVVRIKLLQTQENANTMEFEANNDDFNQYTDNYEDDFDKDDVPEVAQEVMLENTEETVKTNKNNFVLPKLPKLPKNMPAFHVATLQAEAPFFKIIKVQSGENKKIPQEKKEDKKPRNGIIKLADGTKLINANPLAHLLNGKSVKTILESKKNTYYKPVITDFEEVITKALKQLGDNSSGKSRKSKKKNIDKNTTAEV